MVNNERISLGRSDNKRYGILVALWEEQPFFQPWPCLYVSTVSICVYCVYITMLSVCATRDGAGQLSYNVSSTEGRNAFRRFMAAQPHRYDYVKAQVCEGEAEMEREC